MAVIAPSFVRCLDTVEWVTGRASCTLNCILVVIRWGEKVQGELAKRGLLVQTSILVLMCVLFMHLQLMNVMLLVKCLLIF